jgi:hypothetical protein
MVTTTHATPNTPIAPFTFDGQVVEESMQAASSSE